VQICFAVVLSVVFIGACVQIVLLFCYSEVFIRACVQICVAVLLQ
jgi:hypothetical protein